MPGIAELPPTAKLDLLAVVTERQVRRLAGQAFEALLERMHGCLAGLSKSELGQTFPDALRQACAQYGLAEGPCAPHQGVRGGARHLVRPGVNYADISVGVGPWKVLGAWDCLT